MPRVTLLVVTTLLLQCHSHIQSYRFAIIDTSRCRALALLYECPSFSANPYWATTKSLRTNFPKQQWQLVEQIIVLYMKKKKEKTVPFVAMLPSFPPHGPWTSWPLFMPFGHRTPPPPYPPPPVCTYNVCNSAHLPFYLPVVTACFHSKLPVIHSPLTVVSLCSHEHTRSTSRLETALVVVKNFILQWFWDYKTKNKKKKAPRKKSVLAPSCTLALLFTEHMIIIALPWRVCDTPCTFLKALRFALRLLHLNLLL